MSPPTGVGLPGEELRGQRALANPGVARQQQNLGATFHCQVGELVKARQLLGSSNELILGSVLRAGARHPASLADGDDLRQAPKSRARSLRAFGPQLSVPRTLSDVRNRQQQPSRCKCKSSAGRDLGGGRV